MENQFQKIFDSQKENQFIVGNSTYKERIKKLNCLKNAIEHTYKNDIHTALFNDFKKPFTETDLTEIYPIVSEIKFVTKRLKYWVKKQKVATPLALIGTSSWIKYESKGVCLIISPWNFPVNLTFGPLISAIAAGNTVIIKPSEMTPNIASVMAKIITNLFDENEITLIEGNAETSTELLNLPFNHIFFTGSPAIGKVVMSAAAKHLTSVTLELGGKSPTIIDKTANLKKAAKLITWGKFLNNGQTCVSPDYLLIHEDIRDEFIKEMKIQIQEFYSSNPLESSSYCRIVNSNHFNRLTNLITEATNKGAKIEIGGKFNSSENFIEPTIISEIPSDVSILKEEIFGPILPLIPYKEINDAIEFINSKEKPLALYIYSQNKNNISQIIRNTRAGSTCINTNVVQYSNHNLPFGGSNNSGIGKSHGKFGFEEFSNQRSILKQHRLINNDFHFPPYTKATQKFVDFSIKWF